MKDEGADRGAMSKAWESLKTFISHDPLTLSAAIAFYSALSFAPIIVLSIWAVSQLSPGDESQLIDQLGALLGSQVKDNAASIIDQADRNPLHADLASAISLGALAVSASTAFAQLQGSINTVWGVDSVPTNAVWEWIRRRILSFGILAVIGFLLMMTMVVSSAMAIVLTRDTEVWVVLNELITVLLLGAGFALLFRYVPDKRIQFRYAIAGGLITGILFECGKWALGLYLAATASANAYGAASSLVLLLLWVYYSSLIVLVGAAVTRHLAEAFGESFRTTSSS